MDLMNYVINGQPHGDVACEFADTGYNSGLYRPFIDENGNRCVIVNVGMHYDPKKGRKVPTYEKMTCRWAREMMDYDAPTLWTNNATTLSKDQWIQFDNAALKAARKRLRAWSDLAAANIYTLDGMSAEMLEHETINDPGEARVDMEGMADGTQDRHLFQLEGLPLPITHSDFWFSERKLSISRRGGQPLSTLMAEACGQRVAEMVEKTTIGVVTGLTYGTAANYGRAPTVYGFINHGAINTKTLTAPTGENSETTVREVLDMRSTLYDDGFYGPYVVYNSSDWDVFLDADYYSLKTSGATSPTQTLRERLKKIEDVQDVRRLDYLTPTLMGGTFGLVMVSLSNAAVARAVVGMPIKIVQWPSMGGMRLNFKVMCIMAPQIRADYNGHSGINYGKAT